MKIENIATLICTAFIATLILACRCGFIRLDAGTVESVGPEIATIADGDGNLWDVDSDDLQEGDLMVYIRLGMNAPENDRLMFLTRVGTIEDGHIR